MSDNIFVMTGQEEDEIDPTSWSGLPEFVQKDVEVPFTVIARFRNEEDLIKFADLIGYDSLKSMSLSSSKWKSRSIWFPNLEEEERGRNCMFNWVEEE